MRTICAFVSAISLVSVGCCSHAAAASANRPDLIISNFDDNRYGDGWVVTGTAFGNGPAKGTLARQNPVTGFQGSGLVNSFAGGDASTGTLTSPKFVIRRRYLSFLIGGGNKVGLESVNLLVDGKIVRQATGNDSEQLELAQWNVANLEGKVAQIRIVDRAADGWGHILVDDIRQTDHDQNAYGAPIARAMSAVQKAIPKASTDSRRPVYHFHAPAQWMNDPNGFTYENGWYHVFYQFNPYSSDWGNMHWGHARSKDLVNWQHLPIALWPSKDRGEGHVFSGSVFQGTNSRPLAFYTSIASVTSPRDPEVWAATPNDANLLLWRKLPHEPIISEKDHGSVHVDEWRDPFLFTDNGKYYMVTGGEVNGRGVVCLYQSGNRQLTAWKYRGTLFQYPDRTVKNIECPNLVKVDGRWVLLISVNARVEYYTGVADMHRGVFVAHKHGVLNDGSYASQATYDNHGHCIEVAWVRPIGGPSWNGCMSLPLKLSVRPDWTLLSTPVDALSKLRVSTSTVSNVPVSGASTLIRGTFGDTLEIKASIDTGTAAQVDLLMPITSSGNQVVRVRYYPRSRVLSIGGWKDLVLPRTRHGNILDLDIFLDKSLLDVFANGGEICATGAYKPESSSGSGVQVYTTSGRARIREITIHKLRPATFDMSRFVIAKR